MRDACCGALAQVCLCARPLLLHPWWGQNRRRRIVRWSVERPASTIIRLRASG